MSELHMKHVKNELPEDGDICLVAWMSYSEFLQGKEEALRSRFRTLTWKEGFPEDMTIGVKTTGRFVDEKDNIIGAYDVAWTRIQDVNIVMSPPSVYQGDIRVMTLEEISKLPDWRVRNKGLNNVVAIIEAVDEENIQGLKISGQWVSAQYLNENFVQHLTGEPFEINLQ